MSSTVKRNDVVLDRRSVIVLSTLIGAMALGSAFLWVIGPTPQARVDELSPSAASFDSVFETQVPIDTHRWKGIAIVGASPLVDAQRLSAALGEYHFVIGNGRGIVDGSIQISPRWQRQRETAAEEVKAVCESNESVISICVAGDAQISNPTELQIRRLAKLVMELRLRFDIPREHIYSNAAVDLQGSDALAGASLAWSSW